MEQIITSTSPIDVNLAASLIGEAKSAAFKSRAIGIGAAGLALSLGAAAILWAHNQSVDPEMLKAALASMPALKVEGTVKADGEVTVKGTVPAATQPPIVHPTMKPDEDPAIKTTVTAFKLLQYGDGEVVSGWKFATGNAKRPSEQYCHYRQDAGAGNMTVQHIAHDGVISFAVAGVEPAEQAARFQKCQRWQGASL